MTGMITGLTGSPNPVATVRHQTWINRLRWLLGYGAVFMVGLVVAAIEWQRSYQPYLGAALSSLAALLALWIRFPRIALNLTVLLVLIGDTVTVSWFPFNKNLSSFESIMFLTNALTVSPLEITICFALAATLYRNAASSSRLLVRTPLMRPLAVFLVFVMWGLVNGIRSGGDLRVAVFESRPLVYLPLLYVLVANTCTRRRDYRALVGTAIVAIVIQSLLSLHFLAGLPPAVRENLNSLNEHGSAVTMNLLFMMLLGALAFRSVQRMATLSFALAAVPVVIVYFVAERRAAVVALVGGVLYLAISLFWRQRRTFWKFVPFLVIVGSAYVGAFWNSTSSAAFPAQAVKTVIAPEELSAEDQSSNLYRESEKFNLWVTVRSAPVTGIGFGRPFLRPIPLADISSFEFHAYLPHNSVLWLWTKLGFAGFVTFLFMIGRALMLAADRVRRAPDGIDAVVQLALASFIAMYVIFMYVDIAWEPRNVTMLAIAFAAATAPLRDESQPEPSPERRLAVAPEHPTVRRRRVSQSSSAPDGPFDRTVSL